METQSKQSIETGIDPGPFAELDTVTVLLPMPFPGRTVGRAGTRREPGLPAGKLFSG